MSVVVLGGLDRLSPFYKQTGKSLGCDVRHIRQTLPDLAQRLGSVQGIVLFTGMVSHRILREVADKARQLNIPVDYCSGSGISALKKSLQKLKEAVGAGMRDEHSRRFEK